MNAINSDWMQQIRWNEHGLIPVVTQDCFTNTVLMHAWMSEASLHLTLEKGQAVYWSRSRQALWHKGEQSGHYQYIVDISLDCDADTLLLKVEQAGGIACHTGAASCFFNSIPEKTWKHRARAQDSSQVLQRLSELITQRKTADSQTSYVAQLMHQGGDAILKKIGEEAAELIMASKDADPAHITAECADLWFHCLVLLSHHNLDASAVLAELARREHVSGLKEKALRSSTSTTHSS